MNKRKAKKQRNNQYIYISHHHNRVIHRQEHVRSITLARHEHRNFWEEWKYGYPNRFPYMKWMDEIFKRKRALKINWKEILCNPEQRW